MNYRLLLKMSSGFPGRGPGEGLAKAVELGRDGADS